MASAELDAGGIPSKGSADALLAGGARAVVALVIA